jgi:peptidoglycan-associated lipoprotein
MFKQFAVMVVGVVFLAACSSPKKTTDADSVVAPPSTMDSATARADAGDDAASAGSVGDAATSVVLPPELADRLVIYFPFDSDALAAADLELLAQHARFVNGRADLNLRLEGHTDERGTREYNIGLGERRAQAVRRALALQGVAESRLATVSYGEERPALNGSTEDVFAKNRRVELVYGTR